MDYTTLERDASVRKDWVVTEDRRIITRSGCTVVIPMRYLEKQLATFTGDVQTLGIFAIVCGKRYAVSSVNAKVRLSACDVGEQTYGDAKYLELTYKAGDTVVPNTAMVMDNKLPYQIYNEFVAKGRLPWFMGYRDIAGLFDTAKSHANMDLHTNHAIFEMMAAVMARDPLDRTKYFRQSSDSRSALLDRTPVWVAFRNIQSQATNTTTKLMGSYFREALASALVNPAERMEGFEKLLRM